VIVTWSRSPAAPVLSSPQNRRGERLLPSGKMTTLPNRLQCTLPIPDVGIVNPTSVLQPVTRMYCTSESYTFSRTRARISPGKSELSCCSRTAGMSQPALISNLPRAGFRALFQIVDSCLPCC